MKRDPSIAESIAHAELIKEGRRFNRYALARRRMEFLWDLIMAQPIKFPAPARRRRGDRQLAKAA